MRDYQRQKNNKYQLPTTVYHKTLWTIRDYYRIKESLNSIADTSVGIAYDKDKVQTSGNSDMVFKAAVKYGDVKKVVDCIEDARERMPDEYQQGVWNNILFYNSYPRDADRSTYGRVKSKFIYDVAEGLGYII
jgi:hypothetical protein